MPKYSLSVVLEKGLKVHIHNFTEVMRWDEVEMYEVQGEETCGMCDDGWVIASDYPISLPPEDEDTLERLIELEEFFAADESTGIVDGLIAAVFARGVEMGIRYAHEHPASIAVAKEAED